MLLVNWLKPSANYSYNSNPSGYPLGTTAIVEPGKVTYFGPDQLPEEQAYVSELEAQRARAGWLRVIAAVLILAGLWMVYKKK
ncbi:hypothetical protein GCM10023185_13170 [Hymenobacter saemangeumensis]|uniref:DUF3592 domain-containing protein n=1 Tax=Hymenobacter saemangeumensis TaxID=1084522 RepID=A0ABP8I7I1_9BACT